MGPDPGDRVLLELAAAGIKNTHQKFTINDTDFGQLVFLEGQSRSGLIRLPDVSSSERVAIIKDLIERFRKELESHAILTVRGGKIRISASSE